MCELKYLIKQANKVATEKGFWEDFEKTIEKMGELSKDFSKSDIERVRTAFYNEKISLITSELGEATEAMRLGKFCELKDDGFDNINNLLLEENAGEFKYQGAYRTHIKDTFEDEIADSFIRLFDLCYKMDIDIEKFIDMKMKYNKTRDVKHGKKF